MSYPKKYSDGDFLRHNIVFVYGTLKSKNLNNIILEKSPMLSKQAYTVKRYGFYDFGPYPFALEFDPNPTRIWGEVYQVDDPYVRKELDYLEGYPELYYRKLIRIQDKQDPKKAWSAWTYFLNNDQKYVDLLLLNGKIIKNNTGKW